MIFILSLSAVTSEDSTPHYAKSTTESRNKERNKLVLVLEDVLYIKLTWFLMFFIHMFTYIFISSTVSFVQG